MVERSGAHSTQLLDEEDVVSLTAKCEDAANNWSARADTLWKERNEEKARQEAERAARNAARQGAKNKKTEEEIYQP